MAVDLVRNDNKIKQGDHEEQKRGFGVGIHILT